MPIDFRQQVSTVHGWVKNSSRIIWKSHIIFLSLHHNQNSKDMSVLNDIKQLPEYKGIKLNSFILIPARFFGKDCNLLYKIIGFNPKKDLVYANKRNKKTLQLNGNSFICEGFKYSDIIKLLN
jgi:hypothetical protein